MGYIVADGADDDDSPPGCPVIGWDNVLTVGNISTTTADADFPGSNLANPATHLKWKGLYPVALLLHFDGTDASTTFTDSSPNPKTFTASGNAQIDTAQSKFGGASGLFDGTADFIYTSDSSDFTLGSGDFTIACWFNCNAAGATLRYIAGQTTANLTGVATASWIIARTAGNVILARVVSGTTNTDVTGTTQFTNAVNTGWHHLAFVRVNNVLKLFIDGIQEGGDVAYTSTINDSSNEMVIAGASTTASDNWLGWIDEFRFVRGKAVYTSAFTPPTTAFASGAIQYDEYLTITATAATTVDYVGIAKHNFSSGSIPVTIEGNDPAHILLHFNGTDGSVTITDNNTLGSAHSWSTVATSPSASIDTADSKFGGSSLLVQGQEGVFTAANSDFYLTNFDFTIDCWFKCNAAGGTERRIAGQYTAVPSTDSFYIARTTGNVITALLSNGTSFTAITGTTQVTNAVNTGWHHLAFIRTGTTLRLFIDGTQEGGDVSFEAVVPSSAVSLAVGSTSGAGWVGWLDEFRLLVGTAVWTSTFTPPTQEYGWHELVSSYEAPTSTVMLHFDGADASNFITDINTRGSNHIWNAVGNAQIDTAISKFGGGALLCDGTGDYVTTPSHADFNLGSGDFTIDCWFNVNTAGGTTRRLAGHGDAADTATTISWRVFRTAGNVIQAQVLSGGAATTVTGTTQFTNAVNIGWHHMSFVRTSNVLKLFIDGIQEGSSTAFTGRVDDSSTALSVGRTGEFASDNWAGSVDEFRITIGTALWTTTFTPPTTADSDTSLITDDAPLIYRFDPTALAGVRIHMRPTNTLPEAAVVYAGDLLVLERSITIGRGHVPITYGRRTTVVNGMSESGNFLGRIVLGEHRQSKAEFEWFTDTFYRSDIDDFLASAQEFPFFWAWSPVEYPAETGYVWLTNNAEPEVDPVTRRIALELEMRGVA